MNHDEPYQMKVTRIPWDPANYILDGSDVVFGMLLEIPDMYYVTPNRQLAFVFIIGRGMVKLHHDFSDMDETEIDRFIYHIREQFTIT
jgi:hypothetical protein